MGVGSSSNSLYYFKVHYYDESGGATKHIFIRGWVVGRLKTEAFSLVSSSSSREGRKGCGFSNLKLLR